MKKHLCLQYCAGLLSLLFTTVLFAQQPNAETSKLFNRGRISPSIVTLKAGDQQQFNIIIAATRLTAPYNPSGIEWSVNNIPGGNSKIGTITTGGLYKAPASISGATEINITGKVKAIDNPVITATVLLNGEPARFKTLSEFGESAGAFKHFKKPVSITVEKNGNYLIADDKILRFSADGKFISSFGEKQGDILGHLDGLLNVAVDNNGKIFASDQKITPPRIMAFTQQGQHLYSFGYKGHRPGMSFNTRGIDFDSKNRMYIGDIDLQRVTVFDNAGKYLFHFGTPGTRGIDFNGYYDLALDQNNDVFVANYFGGCQKLDATGHYIFSFATANPPDGIIYTTDVATDSRGNVYVVVHGAKNEDGTFNVAKDKNGDPVNIIKYNNNGDFVSNIRLSDTSRIPMSFVIDHTDRLVVLFKNNTKTGVEVLKAID